MKTSWIRRMLGAALAAVMLIQYMPAAIAADPYPQVQYVEGDSQNEDDVWIQEEQASAATGAAAALPSKYDLRDYGFVTPVKNQAGAFNCWTFAAIAALESNYVKQGYGTVDNTDFSEAHLVWFANRQMTTNKNDPTYGDGLTIANPFVAGGNWNRVAATLMRGAGLQLEQNAPWIVSYGSDSDQQHLNRLMQMAQPESARYVSYARMLGVQSIRDKSITAFKQKIMQNGASTLSYYHDVQPDGSGYDVSPSFNTRTASYYQKAVTDSFNHSVAIVGWDDNYPRTNFNSNSRPAYNGAWLVKGSWGTSYGNNGYYWLSYYDPSINEMASYIAGPADLFDHIYQYDGAFPNSRFILSTESAKMANIFNAQRNELLTHAAFFSRNATPVKATVEIYTLPAGEINPANHPTKYMQKVEASTTTVNDVEYGYTTVELAKPVALRKDQTFSVVVTLSQPGGTVEIPVEGEAVNPPNSEKETYNSCVGDSFINYGDGKWWDTSDLMGANYNNVPIKAMTRDVTLQQPEATVAKAPNQTRYRVGDTLNPAGLALLYTDEFGLSTTVTEGITCTPTVLSEIGTQTVTATCNGVSTTFTVTVEPYETKLTLTAQPTRTTYMVGDTLDTTGLSLQYLDAYNREHTVTDGFVCEPSVLSVIGSQTVRVTYADKSVSFVVTVEPYETSLTVRRTPDRLTYMVGETLDTSGMILVYTDEYGKRHTVTEGFVCSPRSLNTIGTQTVTVTYGAASAAFDVRVDPYQPTLTLQKAPFKTTYLYGETLDTTGLSLLYTDEYGDAVTVTDGFVCDTQTLSTFGTRTVTVTYQDLSVTFEVQVEPYERTLTLQSPPTKTEYLYGEMLDTSGMSLLYRNEYGVTRVVTEGYTCDALTLDTQGIRSVTVTYRGLSVAFDVTVELHEPTLTILAEPEKTTFYASETVDTTGLTLLYTDEYGVSHTVTDGFTRTPGTLRVLGEQTVTVTYRELSVTYGVTVEPLEPTLSIKSLPDKTAYLIGETLDTTGLALLYTDELGDALVVTEGYVCDPAYFSKIGDQRVTVAYNGLSTAFDVTVDLREPTLTIVSMPDTTRYFEGESPDLTGLKLVYSDEYGSVTEITDGFTYDSVTFDTLGYQTITVTYGDLSVSFEVKVVLMDPTLEIKTLPGKRVYPYGEPLDTTGLTLAYTDDLGSVSTVTDGFVCMCEPFSSFGEQTVTATYLGLSVSFTITVEPLEPTLTLQSAPKKTAYMVFDKLDPTGLTLVYTDEYGDALVVTEGYTCEPQTLDVFGSQAVTVTYNGLSVSFDVMVSAYEPTLTVLTPPDKTTYLVGELLDTTGLTLRYTDEYSKEYTVEYGFIFDVHTLSEIGTQTVTVTYGDISATFRVEVKPYETTLSILRTPDRTAYTVRETLDPAGMILRYTDEYNKESIVTEGFVCSPQTLREIGTQTVTVTYGAASAAFDVQVEPYETTLTLYSAPAKTIYLYGETLVTTGLSLLYTNEYGDAFVVTDGFSCDVTDLTEFGTQTVTASYMGRSVTFTVTVEPHERTLDIVTPPEKTTYLYGETFDASGLTLQYKDEYGMLHTITEGYVCDASTLDEFGTKRVTVTYNGLTDTLDVTVEPHEKTLKLLSLPDVTTCLAAQAPDVTGMTLVYTDEYGASFTVTEGFSVSPETFRALGTQTVTVSYEGISVTYDVTVEPIEPTLTLQFTPSKTDYLTGETPRSDGIMLLYENEVGEVQIVTDGFSVSPERFTSAGEQTVTITYNGVSTTFDVTVELREPTLTLAAPPARTAYRIGETFDTTGLSLTYTDELGDTHTVTSGFGCDTTTLSEVGTHTVTVTYAALSVTFGVTVTAVEAESIRVATLPANTTYMYTRSPDFSGLSVIVHYNDGHEDMISNLSEMKIQPESDARVRRGTRTFVVTAEGKSATFDMQVNLVWWQWLILIFLLGFLWY